MADGGSYAVVVAAAQATAVAPTTGGGGAGGGGGGAGGGGAGGGGDAGGGSRRNMLLPLSRILGLTFNDATRALEGGLWQNVVEEGGQGHGSIGRYTTDLTNVQTGLQAEVAAGQFTGDTLTHVNTILADITTALSAATASVTGGGTFGSVAAAETALHTSHLDILNIVNNDPNLAAAATQVARQDSSQRRRLCRPAPLRRPRLTPISPRSAPSSTISPISHLVASTPTTRPRPRPIRTR